MCSIGSDMDMSLLWGSKQHQQALACSRGNRTMRKGFKHGNRGGAMVWKPGCLLIMLAAAAPARAETPVDLLFDEQDSVITATESQRALGQAPAIVTVITEQQIRDMGAHTLIDALETVPGLGISYPQDFGTSNTLTVRGLKTTEAEKTLLLINGHRVNNPYSGSWNYLFDEFPLDDVRRIEIIRGPGSALYGSNAMAAVIHVITNTADGLHSSRASVSAGNNGLQRGHITTGNNNAEQKVMLSLDASSTHGSRLPVARDAVGASGTTNFWRRQQSGFLSYSSGNWSLFAMQANKRRGSLLDGTNQIDHSTDIAIRQSVAALTWKQEGDDWDAELRTDADLFNLDPNWQLYGGALTVRSQVKDLTLTGRGLLHYRGWKKQEWTLSLGYDHIRQYGVRTYNNGVDVSATLNHNRNAVRQVPALVIQNEWSPVSQLTLTTGLRMERYSDVGSHFSPRFAAIWSPSDMLDIKAMYGHAFRAPNFIELYSSNNPSIVGNTAIRPETVDTFELGGSAHDGIWHLDSNIYYSRYNRQIARIAPSPLTINAGRTDLKGVEIELRADVQKGLYGSLFYTWQTGSNSSTGQKLPGVPNQMVRISGDAPLPFDTHLHGDVQWTGSQQRALGDPRPALAPTWVADLAMRTGNPVAGPSASFSVKNLFNHKIYSPLATPTMSDLPIYDRQFMLSLSYAY
ncbi:TonB-dependent receptor [Mariprofundus erugo]|nr:TonB-dependent receptor [Mariprofundus erugo]